jgi:hypothetical protein
MRTFWEQGLQQVQRLVLEGLLVGSLFRGFYLNWSWLFFLDWLWGGFLRGGSWSSSTLGVCIDFEELCADLDGITFFGEVFGNDSSMCGEDIYGNFVSFNASNNLVCFYEFTHVFDEFFNDSL